VRLFWRKEKKEEAPQALPVFTPSDTVSFRDALQEALGIAERTDASLLKPLTLAYIGDAVYEAANRLIAVSGPERAMAEIHKECTERARAESQARIAEALQDVLTEEEMKVYLRARNAHTGTRTRSATSGEYHKATGLEAVFGYLYLLGRYDRIAYLLRTGSEQAGIRIQ
jgi:ribonuclease-3 family protein